MISLCPVRFAGLEFIALFALILEIDQCSPEK
jgi:hypothetical protein